MIVHLRKTICLDFIKIYLLSYDCQFILKHAMVHTEKGKVLVVSAISAGLHQDVCWVTDVRGRGIEAINCRIEEADPKQGPL